MTYGQTPWWKDYEIVIPIGVIGIITAAIFWELIKEMASGL